MQLNGRRGRRLARQGAGGFPLIDAAVSELELRGEGGALAFAD